MQVSGFLGSGHFEIIIISFQGVFIWMENEHTAVGALHGCLLAFRGRRRRRREESFFVVLDDVQLRYDASRLAAWMQLHGAVSGGRYFWLFDWLKHIRESNKAEGGKLVDSCVFPVFHPFLNKGIQSVSDIRYKFRGVSDRQGIK